jgi:hypothetical protein
VRGARSFVHALAFAAGIAVVAWLLALPLAASFGPRSAARALIVGGVAAQLALTAPSRRRGCAAAGLAVAGGALVLLLPLPVSTTALLAAALLGACRSGVLYRARPARALAVELLLLVGGLALGHTLSGGFGGSLPLALWGFWLVQSGYFLVGGVVERDDPDPAGRDPFEQARSRILALLEDVAIR